MHWKTKWMLNGVLAGIIIWLFSVLLGIFLGNSSQLTFSTLLIWFLTEVGLLAIIIFFLGAYKENNQVLLGTQAMLKQQQQALLHTNKELEQYSSILAHDLQIPLASVIGIFKIVNQQIKDKINADTAELIDQAMESITSIQLLIKDLLALAQLKKPEKKIEMVDSSLALNQALSNLSLTIDSSKAVVTHNDLPRVRINLTQMTQVFQNLIGNAIKFQNDSSPVIHISSKQNLKEWIFSIKDNGIGIKSQQGNKIFNMFQRLHGNEYEGTGIGLAICKKIIENYGGRIWFDSQPEDGTTFFFTIPKNS